jgi:tRNA pseudouridine38-40 synthase
VRGVNAFLPESIAVLWGRAVDPQFHARFSALSRTYRYRLINRPVRPALEARQAGWYHATLDVDAMREAARALVGEHDFSAFRAAECQAKTPIRTVHSLSIERFQDEIYFVIRANAFLHHMVRNIVGSLVYVGAGRQPPGWIAQLLAGRDRTKAAPTFAPEGLYLERIEYDAKWALPQ